ncbi:hypothetical protein C9374_009695 [Naegleria lovaniensis]|uniref:5-formyltetrahydrofolate cyclo-ligase n=1 Tax=Naegleria lovaniensis TaxID=51637 RepID=A0AA88H1Z1_NAELO|nr:uncharacterized protein C9374_009695 [Naegleria lovaniensis]KAG2393118.1 hypothetical protein C9374_009695 [Naegleria lovaniensis]
MKAIFRRFFKKQLAQLSSHEITEQSKTITNDVLNRNEFYKNCTHVCCYIPMQSGAEVNTMDIIMDTLKQRKQLFIPVITTENDQMEMVQVKDELDFGTFELKSKYKLLEPPEESLPYRKNLMNCLNGESKLLVIVPGLAFDFKNQRLGRGKGHYDKFFARLEHLQRQHNFETYLLGVCFSCQYIDEKFQFSEEVLREFKEKNIECNQIWTVPTELHDKKVDQVLKGL